MHPLHWRTTLKALGILRVVGQQVDSHTRGWWQDEHFCLLTTLDRNALEGFFLEQYEPAPFVSPWNKGSGFFKPDDPGHGTVGKKYCSAFRTVSRWHCGRSVPIGGDV